MSQSVPPELLRQFFEQGIPFNQWLGLKILELKEGDVVLHMPFREEMIGDPFRPALHGGVTAALLDATGGAAIFSLLGLHERSSTIDFRVDFLKPGRCADVYAHARVLRKGNRMAAVSAQAYHAGEEDQPFAACMGVYNIHRVAAR